MVIHLKKLIEFLQDWAEIIKTFVFYTIISYLVMGFIMQDMLWIIDIISKF